MTKDTATTRLETQAQWERRGFSCDLWVDPPGQIWTDFIHDVDELVLLLDGRLELELDGSFALLEPGQELLIPAGTRHTVRNVSDQTARWLYGYRLEQSSSG